MRRADLRKTSDLAGDFGSLCSSLRGGEVATVIFEIGDFSFVDAAFELADSAGCEVLNSLKFNQSDWMMVLKGRK